MTQTTCAGSIQLCALRIARLDGAGVPNPGSGNLYVTNAMISLSVTSELTEGIDEEIQNGCGEIAASLKDDDRLKRLNLTLELAVPDPEITEMLVGGETITDGGGDAIGYAYPEINDQPTQYGVSMEAWTKRIDGNSQANDYPYFRWVFPKTTWAMGDRAMDSSFMVTNFTGFGVENSNFFDGPLNDWSYTSDRVMQYAGDTAIPETTCGSQSLSAS